MSEKGKLSKFWLWELTRPAFEDAQERDRTRRRHRHRLHRAERPPPPPGHGLPRGEALHPRGGEEDNSVCLHLCWSGYSPHHMGFRGTVTLSENTLFNVLLDTIGSLAQHGVRRFEERVRFFVDFINPWKTIPIPPAFKD